MKIVGLITEYNPFHNGHLYHIEESKRITGADMVIVVMSGDFVQRGAPAIMPKHLRAEMAILGGADAVFELPVRYATGSAEYFALGAVSFLNSLGCVDCICFGSELGTLAPLKDIAAVLFAEPPGYLESLKSLLKSGLSYPVARAKATVTYTNNMTYHAILNNPNNILAIEYLKALRLLNSNMIPYTIKRQESHYHDTTLQVHFSSATAIRSLLSQASTSLTTLKPHVPSSSYKVIERDYLSRFPIFANDFSLILQYKLLNETKASLANYMDVSQPLANRIIKQKNRFINFEQFCELLKTKELTYSRISRGLLHIILGIKKEHLERSSVPVYHHYAHLLGFQKKRQALLTQIKEKSPLLLLTKLTSIEGLSKEGVNFLEQDIYCSNIYESIITNKFQLPFVNEFKKPLVKF